VALILAPSSAGLASAAGPAVWFLTGNSGTNPSLNFLGTTDSQPLVFRTNSVEALRVLAGSGTTGGSVGIGTTTPAFRLDVAGDVNGTTLREGGTALGVRYLRLDGSNATAGGVPISITGTAAGDWHSTGNAGTTPGTSFLGTTDNQPLEVRVNNQRALRLEPASDPVLGFSPNVIEGFSGNSVAARTVGATIAGGGVSGATNVVTANYGAVGGGNVNTASGVAATVGGGTVNKASGGMATVGGGGDNLASGGSATVGGGEFNTASGPQATVGGGVGNTASGGSATVAGGTNNTAAGANSFAAGTSATVQAAHSGTFLYADDSSGSLFNSTAANEFAARATGGVRLVTAVDSSGNPTQSCSIAGGTGNLTCSGTISAQTLNGTVANATNATNATTAVNFTGSLGGDVSGTQGATAVGRIQGVAVSPSAPTDGQILAYSQSAGTWQPTTTTTGYHSHQIVSQTVSVACCASNFQHFYANCPAGWSIVGGGFAMSSTSQHVWQSEPINSPNDGWHVEATDDFGPDNLTVRAVCVQ
jgi:hypothetical protein